MAENNELEPNRVGIIPDFFHDIIAYIIPGYTALILFVGSLYIIGLLPPSFIKDPDIKVFSISVLVAYVVGRFFEQLGLMTIHHRKFPFFGKSGKILSPKWSLLFEEDNKTYTDPFKSNVIKKITKWLEKQDGSSLVEKCKEDKKDDYFNLIQFYLRERFPAVALYEKKQNATIVLTRSLAIIFVINILIYHVVLFIKFQTTEIYFSRVAFCWIMTNLLCSWVFYKRFHQDKTYHAMYIFETFISMKKLLKSSNDNNAE